MFCLPFYAQAAVRLNQRSDEQIPQLRRRQLLPALFQALKDPDIDVRVTAASSLALSGPQGILLLVEGLQRDYSAAVRAACAVGLSSPAVGTKASRVLMLALRDKNTEVCCDSRPLVTDHRTDRVSPSLRLQMLFRRACAPWVPLPLLLRSAVTRNPSKLPCCCCVMIC